MLYTEQLEQKFADRALQPRSGRGQSACVQAEQTAVNGWGSAPDWPRIVGHMVLGSALLAGLLLAPFLLRSGLSPWV